MVRVTLVCILCLALALLGVTGVHAHVPGAASEGARTHVHEDVHTTRAPQLVTLMDADHFTAHQHHGDVDIELTAKAFGTPLLLKLFAAIVFVFGVAELLNRTPSFLTRRDPPRRPPKNRLRLYFLPPSHAPPFTAFAR